MDESPTPLERLVASNVRAELARAEIKLPAISAQLGFSPATAARRASGSSPWQIAEIERLAAILNVPASRFFE